MFNLQSLPRVESCSKKAARLDLSSKGEHRRILMIAKIKLGSSTIKVTLWVTAEFKQRLAWKQEQMGWIDGSSSTPLEIQYFQRSICIVWETHRGERHYE